MNSLDVHFLKDSFCEGFFYFLEECFSFWFITGLEMDFNKLS